MSVMVFITSVDSDREVRALAPGLNALAGPGRWNFDLDDCDRILRITSLVIPGAVSGFLQSNGFDCAELDDAVPESLTLSTKFFDQCEK